MRVCSRLRSATLPEGGKEIERLPLLGGLLSQFQVKRRQAAGEVRRRDPGAFHRLIHDHVHQHVPGPPVLDDCRGLRTTFGASSLI